ncbi:MAG: DOMON domain-containing protein [Bacteroidota bacterium]|nr:DOMON domain-containing protein [uncultured Allomuricauda sp.]
MRINKNIGPFIFMLLWFVGLSGQQTVGTNGIKFSYTIKSDSLFCTLKAETQGWLGIGFNFKNSIVGSDLLLFNHVNGIPSCRDMYVKSFGNPKRDVDLGGACSIRVLGSEENNHSTTVRFSIPMQSDDPFDFNHTQKKEYWLILAYAVADEFEHHSRVRKHIPFKLVR